MTTSLPTVGLPRSLAELYAFLQAAPQMVNVYETILTGDDPVDLNLGPYHTKVRSGGTKGDELLNIGDGTGAIVGQRKLITFETQEDPADVVKLDDSNIVLADGSTPATSVELDTEGQFILLEWNGTKWQIVYSDATVTS